MRSLRDIRGTEVTAKGKRVGWVDHVLFAPGGTRVIGYAVERPRLALVVERRERYLALDSAALVDGKLEFTGGADSWDARAAKRLGISWDDTVVWLGMPVVSEDGARMGDVRDATYSETTGELEMLGLTQGVSADLVVGLRDVEAALVIGFDHEAEAIRLKAEAAAIVESGGVAAAAGKGAAVAKQRASEAAQVAGVAAKKAAEYGTAAAKAAAGSDTAKKAIATASAAAQVAAKSETAKKARGWLKAIKDEVVDAMGAPEDDD